MPSIGLFFGLFLLGLVLGLIRRIDNGSLWGCVGLHGGLVGSWFVVTSGIQLSSDTPVLLFGPGGSNLNPIGGLLGICALSVILLLQRTAWAIAGPPFNGARNASSSGASP